MAEFQEKEINQAILVAEDENQLHPLAKTLPMAMLPLVNVPLLDYALEALNRSGIDEVFVFSNLHSHLIQEYIKKRSSDPVSWSIKMRIHVIGGGEGCRCFGDAMRDLDAKGLIRGNFVLLTADTITNVNLCKILEEHKKTVKYDRGAAATIVLKPTSWKIRTGNELLVAVNPQNKRLQYHRRLAISQKESQFNVPLEVFTQNTEIEMLHGISDPQITVGSPSMLSLFSDNFDFETRDDFINGLLINEDILDSRIYVSILGQEEYARKVNNWLVYQLASRDIINRWAYPLVPDMGIICLTQQYVFLKNNIYRSPQANLLKVQMRENVVIQSGSSVGCGSILSDCVIGSSVKIGHHCRLNYAFIFDNVTIGDNCVLEYCAIGPGTKIGANSQITDGTIVDGRCNIPTNSQLSRTSISRHHNNTSLHFLDPHDDAVPGDSLRLQKISHDNERDCGVTDNNDLLLKNDMDKLKIGPLPTEHELSDYISSSDESDTLPDSPAPDDDNIFLSEILDSMTRCFQEHSNPEFLILEINSSRYAYAMSLKDVNINVVKAMFSLPIIKNSNPAMFMAAVNAVLKQLGPVLRNYIKDQEAMFDCLKGLEDIFQENELIQEKFSQIIYMLYDKDFLSEETILTWHKNLDDEQVYVTKLRQILQKLIDWLEQSSAESSDEE